MLPSSFVTLAALPLMANGKLIAARCRPLEAEQREAASPLLMPQSAAEQAVAAIWRRALRVEQIGRHDNFFDLGGHSLLLGQIHTALQGQFAQSVALVDLFAYPTVSALAQFLSQAAPEPPARVEENAEEQARAGAQPAPAATEPPRAAVALLLESVVSSLRQQGTLHFMFQFALRAKIGNIRIVFTTLPKAKTAFGMPPH